jgi:hypothetical protein
MYARPPPPAISKKLKEEPKKAPLKSTTQKPKPAIIDLDDDEIEVVKPGQTQSLQTTTSSRKRNGEYSNTLQTATTSRKRSGDYNNNVTGLSSGGPSTSVASESNPQAKRSRKHVIELD